jgi:hypothetical protein
MTHLPEIKVGMFQQVSQVGPVLSGLPEAFLFSLERDCVNLRLHNYAYISPSYNSTNNN